MVLPIHEIRPRLVEALRQHKRFVLQAPTGSGKSTQIPQMLVDEGLTGGGRVVVLQPRRIAARMLARRVAEERGVRLGTEVGYQVRLEGEYSLDTKILYITEGILLRQMLSDPLLRGIGAVIFDEFHERHLYGDVSLAQAVRLQRARRPDLLIGVMSATLETRQLEQYLAPCATLESKGRTYPVRIAYSANAAGVADKPVWEQAAWHFNRLAREEPEGDFLIFMPGAYEIHRTISELERTPEAAGCRLLPLHGELPPKQQDEAMERTSKRKVVVATNVAETSLTIDGVRIVIDAGLARIPAYDPHRGINTLLVQKISQASSDQRAGRAGRTAPGVCLRLWGEREHLQRPAQELPEVRRLDLSEIVLTLLASGIDDLGGFPWFEAPDAKSLQRAFLLLEDLGAIIKIGDLAAKPTDLGLRLAQLPLHPRYGRLFLAAAELGCLERVALVVAISQGRNVVLPLNDKRSEEARDKLLGLDEVDLISDFQPMVAACELVAQNNFDHEFCRKWGLHGLAIRQAWELAGQLLKQARRMGLERPVTSEWEPVAKALLAGFSDQLAVRLDEGTFRCALVHGRKGELRRQTVVRKSRLLITTEIEERDARGDVTVLLGQNTAVKEEWLREYFPNALSEATVTYFDASQRRVFAAKERRFRDLVLERKDGMEPPLDDAASLLTAEVLAGRLVLKNWDATVDRWIERVNFCAQHCPDFGFAPIGEDEKKLIIEQICHGETGYKALKDKEVFPFVQDWVSHELRHEIDRLAPENIPLPTGQRIRLRYEPGGKAVVTATIQQLYDFPPDTRLAANRAPLTFELLAPNRRPIQITNDLRAFWQNSYPEVKKQLKGRYPKHEWR